MRQASVHPEELSTFDAAEMRAHLTKRWIPQRPSRASGAALSSDDYIQSSDVGSRRNPQVYEARPTADGLLSTALALGDDFLEVDATCRGPKTALLVLTQQVSSSPCWLPPSSQCIRRTAEHALATTHVDACVRVVPLAGHVVDLPALLGDVALDAASARRRLRGYRGSW